MSAAPSSAAAERSTGLALGVGVAIALLLGGTTCPTITFGDAPELIAAAAELGVAHPPGYPLYTLLGRLALALPLGEPAWRVNLMSALFAAATCSGVCLLVRRWTGSAAAAVGAALALAASSTFWASATVAEVYTLHLLLITALLLAATPGGWRPAARAAAAGAVVGLGLAHRPTVLLALPAAAILAGPWGAARIRAAARSRTTWIAVATALTLPALFYLGMMLRSQAGPASNWGQPDDLAALWAHVTGQRYGSYFVGPAGWLLPGNLTRIARELGAGLGYVVPLLALVAFVGAWRLRSGGRVVLALLALALPTLLFASSYATPDAEVLLLPTVLAVVLAAGAGIATLARRARRAARPLAWSLVLAAVAPPLVANLPQRDLRRFTAAQEYMQDMTRTLPVGGILFVEGDDTFLLAYLTRVLGQRTDLTIYDRSGQLFADLLDEPGASMRPGEGRLTYRIRRERDFMLQTRRPVYFSSWPGYPAPPGLRFEPVGLFQQVRPDTLAPRDVSDLWAAYRSESVREQAARIGSTFARAVAARYPTMRAERALFEGDASRAAAELEQAAALAADDEATQVSIGAIHGRVGDYPRAIRAFEKAVALQPVSIRAWNNLGLARSLSGDVAGARRAWERSLAIMPDQPETRRRLAGLPG